MSWNLVGRPRAPCTGRACGSPARVMLSHSGRSLNVASVHQTHCVCYCTGLCPICASRIWSGASLRTATGRRVTGRPGITVAAKAAPPSATIEAPSVVVEMADRNSRRLYAHIAVPACPSKVWQSLTDYDNLDDFIPGLAENECLERLPTGCVLRQVGEQDVAFGASFRAAVTLTILEHRGGAPPRRLESIEQRALSAGTLLPLPRSPGRGAFDDITFELINGDFQAFRGVWRIQDGQDGPDSCLLAYAVVVKPQRWLPVRLIQGRIEREVKANLQAVAVHASEL